MDDPAADREVRIERAYDAPRDLVWRAWTEPARLARWYAPRACAIDVEALEARPGGALRFTLRDAAGAALCRVRGTFIAVDRPARLSYAMHLVDEGGRRIEPAAAGKGEGWPAETTVTVTLAEDGPGRTRVTLHQTVLESIARRTGAYPSWLEMLDRLAETLAGA